MSEWCNALCLYGVSMCHFLETIINATLWKATFNLLWNKPMLFPWQYCVVSTKLNIYRTILSPINDHQGNVDQSMMYKCNSDGCFDFNSSSLNSWRVEYHIRSNHSYIVYLSQLQNVVWFMVCALHFSVWKYRKSCFLVVVYGV